jgi:hypothetical protein
MLEHPLPFSFNEIYLEELRRLRPNAFEGATAEAVVGSAAYEKVLEDNNERRAENLRDLYREVHRSLNDPTDPECAPLSALCLSGGGIRSATFNLGILQELARLGLLGSFDYLSSVSGGGYIAGWFKSWSHRASLAEVTQELDGSAASVRARRNPLAPEPEALDHLREYSNYLTPKVGLFSPDSWTAGALIIRNLLLNWLVVVPAIAAAVAMPQLALLAEETRPSQGVQMLVVTLAMIMALLASVFVHWLRHPRPTGERAGQRLIVFGAVLPVYAAAVLLALGAAWAPWPWWTMDESHGYFVSGPVARRVWMSGLTTFIGVWTILIPLIGWGCAEIVGAIRGARRGRARFAEFLALTISGLVAGLILLWLADAALCSSACGKDPYVLQHPVFLVVAGLPALLGDYLIARTLFVAIASLGEPRGGRAPDVAARAGGATGRDDVALNDFDREWWARLSGWVLALALGWLIFSAICLLGTFVFHLYAKDYARQLVAAMGGVAGIVTALLGMSAGTSAGRGTNTKSESKASHVSLKIVAPIFVLAVLLLLADGNAALGRIWTAKPSLLSVAEALPADVRLRQAEVCSSASNALPNDPHFNAVVCADSLGWFVVGVPLLLLAIAFSAARVVNVNQFSLHGLYRNRLVRAFLGASNRRRKPDPFTGFDVSDDLALASLWPESAGAVGAEQLRRPLPVINATLNLVTGSDRLAWQLRKAESFSFTPLFSGNFHEGYRPTCDYGGAAGMSLGTAVTISGAAANPNMGYNSSPTITFLMALLNARLGVWLGNTNEHGAKVYRRNGPRFALRPLIAELLGHTDARHAYVDLSDGGHFDNLGLYEMVLRRCRYILLCDAGRDPSGGFDDLGNVIRKVRIDFGVPIEFVKKIEISPREPLPTGLFCAVADICYETADGAGAPNGRLVYIKPALFGRGEPVPYDVLAYSKGSADFPHESTTDQWFDEAQFESYRALGQHLLRQITVNASKLADFPSFLKQVEQYMK